MNSRCIYFTIIEVNRMKIFITSDSGINKNSIISFIKRALITHLTQKRSNFDYELLITFYEQG